MASRKCLISICVAVALVVIIVGLALGMTLRKKKFKSTFIGRCKKFKGYDCQNIWDKFSQAYVGKNPCAVAMQAYDPLMDAAPLSPACNRELFWSKTKKIVHEFTAKRDCYVTIEDLLLGYTLDGLTWCGKEGSSETFTSGCPRWDECVNNPVHSFWNRASAAFADAACGNVAVMLNGSIDAPFSPQSVFGSIEIKRLKFPKVRNLDAVLVTKKYTGTICSNASLKDLQKALDSGITYGCKEVTEAQIQACSDPEKPCRPCW